MDALLSTGFWFLVLTFTGVNVIFVMGLNLQVGETGLLNFGHVAFMATGAYAMGLMLTHGVHVAIAIPAALLAGALLGIVLGVPTLRLRADYFAITTIAAGEILRTVILNEGDTTGGPQGLISASGPWRGFNRDVLRFAEDHFGWDLDRRVPLLVLTWAVAVVVGLFLLYVTRSPWGRVLRAVRENEEAAAAVGKAVFSYKLQALALGGAIGALAGVFFTFASTTLYPENFLPIVTFTGFAILILGGIGSYVGVTVGAVLISFVVSGTRLIDFPIDPEKVAALRFVIIGLVIMLFMAFRPQGLLGKKEELHLGP
ncbi:MAG: branched-chain amino acid ABC transporter permease [Actinomycetota bacterium]